MFETEDAHSAGILDSPFTREVLAINVREELPLHPGLTSAWQNSPSGQRPVERPTAPVDVPELESNEGDCPYCHRPLVPTEVPELEGPEFEHDVLPLRSVPRDYSLRDIADSDNLPDEIRAAILRDGETKIDHLTDRAFWIRHPGMKGTTLEKTGALHKALREEWVAISQQVNALTWLRQIIDELDKRRGSLPRDFLLGWMAVESDGRVGVVTERPERGYFQIDWPGGEAREQLGLSAAQFRKLSTDRVFSIEKGVELVEKYRQFILQNFPAVPDNSEILWRLTKARHAASSALTNALQGLVQKKADITWENVSAQIPAFMRNNVNSTLDFAARLKPFADLPGSTALAPGAGTAQPEFEQEWRPAPGKNKVNDTFAVPFRWIAKISVMKGGDEHGRGSGVLISDRHVLTAAHVVYDVVQDPGRYHLKVTMALDGNKELDNYSSSKKPDISTKYKPADLDHDYAIITLSRPIAAERFRQLKGDRLCFWGSSACGAGTTAMPVDPKDLRNQTAYTAGYPGNKGGNQMWAFSGQLVSVPEQSPIMTYTGELTEGQSGSPVWIQHDGGYNMVGIAVARGSANRIVRMTWDVVEQLNDWMLVAEKEAPELEFEGDQGEGEAWESDGESPPPGGVHEVLPTQLGELEEHQVTPKGLVLLDHMHVPKAPNPASPGTFTIGALTKLTAADLNPLFFGTGNTLILDTTPTGLQNCLDVLIPKGFGGLLGASGQTGPGPRDLVHVALVDLTGAKLTSPEFAGWGAPADMYGASVPKILALYAAFQLRSDLRDLAARKSPSDGKQLESAAIAEWNANGLTKALPDLVGLFDIRKWTPAATLDFTAATQSLLANIVHNCPAGTLIAQVSLPYIGSVAWQSGLYHPTRSGLWLKASYCNKGSWASPVAAPFVHNATALSAATYFTLLAQGRLVDDASSAGIRNALKNGCVTSLFPSLPVVASKCGLYGGYVHDCAWIQDSSVRYVVAVLSKLATNAHFQLYTQLCGQLDTLVRQNNQSPKSPCSP